MSVAEALELERLEGFLDTEGIGAGRIVAGEIGEGHSNLTFLIERGGTRVVLRRPPLGELAPSANDVVREAKLLRALEGAGVPVPRVLAICEDEALIGRPFYLMELVAGEVISSRMPDGCNDAEAAGRVAEHVVTALAELHTVYLEATGVGQFGHPSGYLERQLRRFRGLLEHNATRPIPQLEQLADRLAEAIPESPAATVVHGDYRLGNLMFAAPGPRLTAVLDWEMGTTGDPLADLGYLTATWAEPGDPEIPMLDLSPVTRQPGFPGRDELARRYADATGRSLDALAWYQALALWKAAIFLEGSYGRHLAGGSSDPYFARLGDGVPALARHALRTLA